MFWIFLALWNFLFMFCFVDTPGSGVLTTISLLRDHSKWSGEHMQYKWLIPGHHKQDTLPSVLSLAPTLKFLTCCCIICLFLCSLSYQSHKSHNWKHVQAPFLDSFDCILFDVFYRFCSKLDFFKNWFDVLVWWDILTKFIELQNK